MISIVLPTYNSLKFLEERVDSILNQSYQNWECIVIDGESSDGTWAYLEKISKDDDRFKMYQFKPKGVYNAWNLGIEKSSGDYIYFATSDDTMSLNCLEKLLQGFDLAPHCGISHCCLEIIDSNSQPLKELDWSTFPAQNYFKEWNITYHVRKAPLTGLLYATHQTIIHSFTQVLISKKVFEKVGYFLEDRGPAADLEWGMRAGMTEDVIHIPLTLATWRVHEAQLTSPKLDIKNSFQLVNLMSTAISNADCSKKVKKIKNYLLAWKRLSLFYKLPLRHKIVNLNFLNLKILMHLSSGFHKALKTNDTYQHYIQAKLNLKKEELIEII